MPYGALQGDIYQMNQMSLGYGRNNPQDTLREGIRLPSLSPQESDSEEKKESPSPLKKPESASPSSGTDSGQMYPSQGPQAPYRGIMQQDIETVSNVFSLWFGDRYRLNEEEQKTFERMVSAAADPVDAAGRYVASISLSKRSGLPVIDVYNNLDAIAEYFTGMEYKASDATFPQLIDASFESQDSLNLKGEWMDLVNEKGRNAPESLALEERIFALDADIDAKGGGIPKNGWDRVKRDVLSSFGYTSDIGTKSGLMSVSLTAAMAPMVASVMAINPIAGAAVGFSASLAANFGGAVVGFNRSRELSEADMFWNLMHQTDEEGNMLQGNPETASIFAGLYGGVIGFMEQMFDGITSRAGNALSGSFTRRFGLSNLSAKVLTDKGVQGTLENIAYAGLDWLAGGLDEGFLQEAPGQLAESVLTAGYQKSIGLEPDLSAKEMAADFFRTGIESTLVGLIYGVPGIPAVMRNNRRLSFDLRRIANQSPSEEVFFERISSKKPDDMSRQVFNEEVGKPIFERKQKFFDSVFGDRANTVMASQDLALEELYDSVDAETGEETAKVLPDGSVYRNPETNRLYTETRTENGRRRVYAGDRNTGAVYGFAEVSTDGDTLSVGSVRVRPGYEGIREELVREAISSQRTGESNISWEPTTEGLMSVRNQLVQNNPRGREAGLDYGADFSLNQDHDIESLSSHIRTAMPNLSREESVVAARLYSIADADNSLRALNNGEPVRTSDSLTARYRGAADGARAIIYAGKNADFSTFYHELFHVNATQRPAEARGLSNSIRSSMQDEASKANLRKFIEESKEIWGDGFNADNVMQHLEAIPADSDASQWTRAQFEDLARLAEAYATADNSKRTTLPEAIRNILRKIADYMRRVYQTVTHTVALPKEITDAYDAIMYKTVRESSVNANRFTQSNRISFQAESSKSAKKEIHDLTRDSDTRNKRITFSEHTPDIFQQFGFNDNPVVMSAGKLKQGLFGDASETSGHSDSLTADIVEQVLDRFADPYYIFSSTHGTDLVAIYDILDKQGNPVLVSLRANQREGRNELNFITSIYGKKGNSIQDWIRAGLLLYRNDTKKLTGVFAARLQLPRGVTPATMNNVRRKSEFVNQGLAFQGGEQYQATAERLRRDSSNFDAEGHHLAPNGKPSNLSYEQWVTVRTPAFKEWFGDWEHAYRISKWLSNDNDLTIDPNAYSGLYELNWRSAKRYALDNLRGQYKVDDNGAVIELTRDGVSEIISENMGSELGLKLVAYIPDIIRNSIFLYAEENQKNKNTFDYYEYYLTDISVDGKSYVVKSAVGVRNGRRYYTFNLSEIKDKGAFINSRPVSDIQPGRPTSQGSLSDIKDTRLLSILQADSSKVVDENGEPLVVYHGSSRWFRIFNNGEEQHHSNAPDGSIFMTDNRDVANSYVNWYGPSDGRMPPQAHDVYLDENDSRHKSYSGYIHREGGIYPLFINMRNPMIVDFNGRTWQSSSDDILEDADINDYANWAKEDGYDGLIARNIIDVGFTELTAEELPSATDYVVFDSTQVKSIDNRGTFDSGNPDIYMQDAKTPDISDLTPEQNEKRKEAEKADSSFTNNEAIDLEGFYDDFDISMEEIENSMDAEQIARIYSELDAETDQEASNDNASLIDEDVAPYFDENTVNILPDGSIAATEAEYENAMDSGLIPAEAEDRGLEAPNPPATADNDNADSQEAGDKEGRRPGISYDDAFDYEMSWKQFSDRNKPDIEWGENTTDAEKDDIFVKAIQDDDTLLRYLGIIGEALYLNTRQLNEDWHFSDQIQRERIKSRVFDVITNTSIRNASRTALKAELDGYELSPRMKSLVRKEMSDNVRFYRNILSWMLRDDKMKPESVIRETRGLDIPSRDTLDAMPINELRALAETAEDKAIVNEIERGTLKFTGGEDERRAKQINDAITSLASQIKDQETELSQNERTISQLESDLDEVTSALSERDRNISSLANTLRTIESITNSSDRKLSGQYSESYALNDRMKKIAAEMSWLDKGRYDEIEAQHLKGRKGKYEIPKAKRDAKEEYISSLLSFYPDIFETDEDKMGKLKGIRDIYSPYGFDKVQEILERRREELRAEWKNEAASFASRLANSTRSSARKLASDIDSALDKMASLNKEIERQKKLRDRVKDNRTRQIFDARTEERWKAAKKALEAEKRYNQEIQNWKSYAQWQKHENRKQLEAVVRKAKDDAALLADWMKAKADNRIAELKKEQKEKQKQARLYRRIREEKRKLARAICRPINLNTTDYATSAEPILAIQAMIDPEFRHEWIPDLENNPLGISGWGTMSIDDARAYLYSLEESDMNDILSTLSPSLVARLTGERMPLNDWTLNELRMFAEEVQSLRKRGREVLSAKKAYERETREAIQKAIITSLNEISKARGSGDQEALPGSIERMKQAQGTLAKFRSAKYITMRMQELAQLLDGGLGHRGAAYQLLVDEKRYHQQREWRAVDKRLGKIAPYLTKEAIRNLFDHVTINFSDGLSMSFTVDELAYIYLSKFDEDSRAAVAYGNLLQDSEKGTLMNRGRFDENGNFIPETMSSGTIVDNDELKALGDRRFQEALAIAENELSERNLLELADSIRADFADPENFRRLNGASIETYNTPLKRVKNYLPIMRTDLRGESFRNDMADALFNLNTGDFNAALDKGMTISRIAISPRHQRGVNLSLLEVWNKSIRNQEHLIEFAGYAKKTRDVFGNNATELISMVDRVYSPALMKEIQGYIDYVIDPYSGRKSNTPNLDKVIRNLRGRVGAAYLGWKLPGIVLQFTTSAWPFLQDMSPATLLKGYIKLAQDRGAALNFIYEKSSMMKHRTMNTVLQEALERRGEVTSSKARRAMNKFEEVGQLGLSWTDKIMVAGGWLGAYEKALQDNLNAGMDTALADAAAVKTADDTVLRVQPAGDSSELPSLFRSSSEVMKIFLQFQSSLSVIWNNLVWDNIGFARNRQFGKIVGSVVAYGMAGLMLGLVADGFDDDDDAKDRAMKMSYWFLTQGIESTPVFGSDISLMIQRVMTGERDYYGNGTDMFPGITKVFSGIEDIVASDKPFIDGVWKIAEGAGIFAGAPTSGIKNLIRVAEEGPDAFLGR